MASIPPPAPTPQGVPPGSPQAVSSPPVVPPVQPSVAVQAGGAGAPPPLTAPQPVAFAPPPYVKPTFWQQEFVQNILPMIIAILLHVGIIGIAVVAAKVVEEVRGPQIREQIIVAEAEMVQAGPEGGI